ncbi:OmpA family protein [Falsiroseomonas tokyonensis]|uniref:OmpA family protein n=1 Tax=Falsiroseomonas tokyonensis TaxID=430521 RepID=A0ABV7BY17_9PROT|nr:hypothetical protein [Falsiroseomonas tokyonensis]MBU8539539.1 hypothetical protein [Falsiroseomonas tokyonensis]
MRLLLLPILLLLAPMASAQTLPPACLFPRGGIMLDEPCHDLLAGIARDWQAARGGGAAPVLIVQGFAQDQQGPRLDGLLSRRRAEAVAEELQRLGIPRDSIEITTPPAEPRDLHSRLDPHSRRAEILVRAKP